MVELWDNFNSNKPVDGQQFDIFDTFLFQNENEFIAE